MRYILVRDICECEDYPCCGHSDEPYPLKEDRARALAKQDEVTLIAYYNPSTDTLAPLEEDRIENFESHRELIERAIEYAKEHPAPIEYRTHAYDQAVDFVLDLIYGMEYEEASTFSAEVYRVARSQPELKRLADIIGDTVEECDWSDDYYY